MLETVKKAGRVLELFAGGTAEWGVTEVADVLDLPKSGAHSILATLTDIGLLERTADRRYCLGWQVVALSRVLLDTTSLRSTSAPVMRQLTLRLSSSSHLAVMHAGRAMCIERFACPSAPPPTALRVGDYLPSRLKASVLLADHDAPEIPTLGHREIAEDTAVFSSCRPRSGPDEPVAPVERHCMAAPIRSYDGEVVAALGVSIPASRITSAAAKSLLQRVTDRLSKQVSTLELARS